MTSTAPERTRLRFPGMRRPKPLLPPETERQLTARQRQVLAALEELVVRGGLSELTMVEIANRVNCSLRTLYGISPSKDELLLAIVDRRLHRIGRAAMDALDTSMSSLDALTYLQATSEAVQPSTNAFSREFVGLPGAKRLLDSHENYVTAITQNLLDRAVAEHLIRDVDTAAVAHVLGGLGREFAAPDLSPVISGSPKETADAVAEIILRGLESA